MGSRWDRYDPLKNGLTAEVYTRLETGPAAQDASAVTGGKPQGGVCALLGAGNYVSGRREGPPPLDTDVVCRDW